VHHVHQAKTKVKQKRPFFVLQTRFLPHRLAPARVAVAFACHIISNLVFLLDANPHV
jgi:hypothetical protein